MNSDRELLELAAKAAGLRVAWLAYGSMVLLDTQSNEGCDAWNPLTDDGDALRLAATLRLEIMVMDGFGQVWCEDKYGIYRARVDFSDDIAADYRRAIVESAAMIGRSMP